MSRRSVLARAAFAIGLAGLAWVLLELHGVFRSEREDRLRTLTEQQRTLEAYAARALADALGGELRNARPRIAAALADPLLPAQDLFLARSGAQVLPRLARPQQGDAGPARQVHARLRAGEPVEAGDDAPWQERLAELERVRKALARSERKALERHVREILRQRSRYVLRASLDLPYMVALMELLAERSAPERSFFAALLREGFGTPGSVAYMPGLQQQLLEAVPRLERKDLAFLAARIVALSEAAGVPHGDFAARASEEPGTRVAHDPAQRAPYLTAGWYIEPEPDARAQGVRVDTPGLVAALAAEMRERQLLQAGDQLVLEAPGEGLRPLAALLPHVESPARESARERAQALYTVKTGLLMLCGALAFGIAALANLAHQRRLRLADLRSSFVAAVSHDLRTPLASIRLQAETLMRRLRGNPEARDYPERIVRDVDGLSFLVENILSFNRLEHGGWQPRRASVSLRELVGALRADLERQIPHKVSVAIEADEDLVLRADHDLMRLLFNNLLRNAVEHNEREPARVRVSWQRRGATLVVRVADNGTGIAAAVQERVFQDFYRPEQSTSKRGTGLGLAICRRIMHAHGGEIRIAESSTEGTAFELDFPEASA